MSSAFFNIARPMAPRLIQCLYYIALVLIALGLLRGIVGGVQMMQVLPFYDDGAIRTLRDFEALVYQSLQ